jgi:hypothetical protein
MRKNVSANAIVQLSSIRQGEKATVLGKSLLANAIGKFGKIRFFRNCERDSTRGDFKKGLIPKKRTHDSTRPQPVRRSS